MRQNGRSIIAAAAALAFSAVGLGVGAPVDLRDEHVPPRRTSRGKRPRRRNFERGYRPHQGDREIARRLRQAERDDQRQRARAEGSFGKFASDPAKVSRRRRAMA